MPRFLKEELHLVQPEKVNSPAPILSKQEVTNELNLRRQKTEAGNRMPQARADHFPNACPDAR